MTLAPRTERAVNKCRGALTRTVPPEVAAHEAVIAACLEAGLPAVVGAMASRPELPPKSHRVRDYCRPPSSTNARNGGKFLDHALETIENMGFIPQIHPESLIIVVAALVKSGRGCISPVVLPTSREATSCRRRFRLKPRAQSYRRVPRCRGIGSPVLPGPADRLRRHCHDA